MAAGLGTARCHCAAVDAGVLLLCALDPGLLLGLAAARRLDELGWLVAAERAGRSGFSLKIRCRAAMYSRRRSEFVLSACAVVTGQTDSNQMLAKRSFSTNISEEHQYNSGSHLVN
jgi:hypothetical protein